MLTVRANTIRSNRKELMKVFKDQGWKVRPTKFAPHGIRFEEHPEGNLF